MQNKTKLNVLQLTERYWRREAEYLCCDDVETQVAKSQGNDAAGSSVSSIYSISVEMSFYSLYMYIWTVITEWMCFFILRHVYIDCV